MNPTQQKQLAVCQKLLRASTLTLTQEIQLCQQAASLLLDNHAFRTSGICYLQRLLDILPPSEAAARSAVLLRLARVHARQCRFADAHRLFLEYLHLQPDDHAAHAELATICLANHQTSVAVAVLRGLPAAFLATHPKVRKDLGISLLQQQLHWDEGWTHFEARLECTTPFLDIPDLPFWSPAVAADCHHLLILDEQGIGDTLQFFRYVLQWARTYPTTHVYFCPKEAAADLLHPTYGDHVRVVTPTFVETNANLFHHKAFLCSLPHLLNIQRPSPLDLTSPLYLRVHSKTAKQWHKSLLSTLRRPLKIGFCLRGSRSGTVEKNLAFDRAVHDCFAPFHQVADFVCLNRRSEDPVGIDHIDHFDHVHFPHTDLGPPFRDTAALVSQLDLVISVDTATAHLAANLGKPVWLLLGALSDWRWGDPGSSCVWYSNVRFFRATQANHFEAVFPQVVDALWTLHNEG